MVYCNFMKRDGDLLYYTIGGNIDDLTGVICIDYVNQEYTVLKKPGASNVYYRHIDSMLRKAQKDFERGIFRERLAYEI